MPMTIRITSSSARKKPALGDRRYLKGRKVWQVRLPRQVPQGMPFAGAWLVSNGRTLWRWVDEGSTEDWYTRGAYGSQRKTPGP